MNGDVPETLLAAATEYGMLHLGGGRFRAKAFEAEAERDDEREREEDRGARGEGEGEREGEGLGSSSTKLSPTKYSPFYARVDGWRGGG